MDGPNTSTPAIEWLDDFSAACASGLVIVTAAVARPPMRVGCLVGFATQVSIDPWRFLVALSVDNRTYEVAQRATHLAVHLVGPGDGDVAELFGGETGDEVDKFAGGPDHSSIDDVVVLDDLPALIGRIRARVPFGDHVGHLLDPVAVTGPDVSGARTLRREDLHGLRPGHPRQARAKSD